MAGGATSEEHEQPLSLQTVSLHCHRIVHSSTGTHSYISHCVNLSSLIISECVYFMKDMGPGMFMWLQGSIYLILTAKELSSHVVFLPGLPHYYTAFCFSEL